MAEGAPGDVGLPGAGEVPAELDAVLAAKLESAAARDAPDLGTDLRAVCGGVLPDAHQVFARRLRRVDAASGDRALRNQLHRILRAGAVPVSHRRAVHHSRLCQRDMALGQSAHMKQPWLWVALACALFLAEELPLFQHRWVEDESWQSIPAHALLTEGRIRNPTFAETDTEYEACVKPPAHTFVLLPMFKWFGVGVWQARLPSLAAGLGVVVLTFLLSREMAGKAAGGANAGRGGGHKNSKR